MQEKIVRSYQHHHPSLHERIDPAMATTGNEKKPMAQPRAMYFACSMRVMSKPVRLGVLFAEQAADAVAVSSFAPEEMQR